MDRDAQEQFSGRQSAAYLWGACFDSSLVLLISTDFQNSKLLISYKVQGEHKVFPWIQTFITTKLRGIQTFFFQNKHMT